MYRQHFKTATGKNTYISRHPIIKLISREGVHLTRVIAWIWHWFDTSAIKYSPDIENGDKIDWVRNIPYFGMYAMCGFVLFVGWSPIALWTAAAAYFIRMFAITGFYHRYFSHKSYKTSRPAQFIFGFLGASAVQRGPLWWAAHHRHHHAHSDGDKDVHSPHRHNFLWSHMLWFTTRNNFHTKSELIPDLIDYPELRWIDRFDVLPGILLGIAAFLWGTYLERTAPYLGTSGWQMLVWAFFISSVILYQGTFSINSLTHMMGKKRYNTGDQSRNSLILALVTLGEGWHNNHHYYKSSTRQGFFWWEVDVTYYLLWVLQKLGIIWDMKSVPKRARAKTIAAQGARA